MSQLSKTQALFNKSQVQNRFTDETKYSSVTVPQMFDGPEHNPINNLSSTLLKELDSISIIANKQILGKSDWNDFNNISGTTTTTTTEAPPNSESAGGEEG